MKKFKFTISGNDYEVEIKKLEDSSAKIEVNGTTFNVELHKEERTSKTPVLVRSSITNPKDAHKIGKTSDVLFKIKAPLPGNILQVFVKVGDEVAKDDKLLVYEAMKMENKLLAEKPGTIKSIKVQPGDSVLQDDLLIELEVN
ncbi:MAG: biotin/lipoyl-containing protein [Bacteroidales bacterium]|jgi:biotin carboxyl carrier protein